jgi:hypothetical protein
MKLFFLIFLSVPVSLLAQDNYEIQVYSSPTQTKGETMVEIHSNFGFQGERNVIKGVRPTYHALHETLEITQGITKNFELGFYIFTNYTSPYGYQVVGTHLRPRVSAPESWKLPVGLSLSTEFGYQRQEYSNETWNIEVRPIIDKKLGKLYLCFNPTFGISIKSNETSHAPVFEPNIKISYAISPVISFGTEYYGSMGPFNHLAPLPDQSHDLFAAIDLFVDPKWELNAGAGWGLNKSSDGMIVKLIVGRHLSWQKKKPISVPKP